jgi:hypothetical protein
MSIRGIPEIYTGVRGRFGRKFGIDDNASHMYGTAVACGVYFRMHELFF